MKTDKKYRKAVCLFYLIGSYLLLLSLVEAIYFLAIPSLGGSKAIRLFLNMGWLYFCAYVYYRLTKRYTDWWSVLEDEKQIKNS